MARRKSSTRWRSRNIILGPVKIIWYSSMLIFHHPCCLLGWFSFFFFLFSLLQSNISYFIVTHGFSVFLAVSVIESLVHGLLAEDAFFVLARKHDALLKTENCLRSSTIPRVFTIPIYSTKPLKVFSKCSTEEMKRKSYACPGNLLLLFNDLSEMRLKIGQFWTPILLIKTTIAMQTHQQIAET